MRLFFKRNFILTGALLAVSQLALAVTQSVTLAWNNPSRVDASIAGYKIYYGAASGNYSNVVTLGVTNSVTISGLNAGATYYFAASTYETTGAESPLSNETTYAVPFSPVLDSLGNAGGWFSFGISGADSKSCVVEASTNLLNWISLQTNIAPFTFVDTNAPRFARRFYRVRAQ